MVKHESNGRWKWILSGGSVLVVIAFVATMWADTRELTKDVPECKAQITLNTSAIQTATQTNTAQDKKIEELAKMQEKTLEKFNEFQIENAEKMGEIFQWMKQNTARR